MTTSSNIWNPFLAKVLASDDGTTGSSDDPPVVLPSTQPALGDRTVTSVGVRHKQRNKRPLRDIVLGLIQTTRPGVKPSRIGRNPAHPVWVSKNQLFAITGFRTEVFDIKNLTITASLFRTTAALTSPDRTSITVKPHGPAWKKFFEHMSVTHTNVVISRRVWAMAERPDNTYEYFER